MNDDKSPKGLYPDELTEFYKMYDSGKYYVKEIAEVVRHIAKCRYEIH